MADSEKLEDHLCDFCSQKDPPYKVYKCRDFAIPWNPLQRSLGDWNACTACAELIDANRHQELATRCAKIIGTVASVEALMMFHQEFFKNRIY